MNTFVKIAIGIGILGGLAGMVAGIVVEPISGSIVTGIFVLVFGLIWFFLIRPMMKRNKIKKEGLPAKGKILKIWDTGVTVNNNPQIGLEVEVKAEGQASWTTQTKAIISRITPQLYRPGMTVNLKYDQDDKTQIAITEGIAETPNIDKDEVEAMLRKIDKFNAELNQSGVISNAIVMEFSPMGINVNGENPAATLTLKVLPENDDPFTAKASGVFGKSGLHKYQPGKEVKVKYDPQSPENVTIAFE